jgi:type I restriction enzyme S subunit
MKNFEVGKDFETSERAGAGGMFQVDTLIDENGVDITSRIDVGKHFHDDDELKEELSGIFGIPIKDIDLTDL